MLDTFGQERAAPESIRSLAPDGAVSVVTREKLASCPRWPYAFGNQRKDRRYYEIVEDTLREPVVEFRYLVMQEHREGGIRAVQPFFLLDQDLTAGVGRFGRSLVAAVRRFWPRFLKMQTLMVGCAAGEGHLDADGTETSRWVGERLAAALPGIARQLDARLVVMKEFPSSDREALGSFPRSGFARVPSLPMTRLGIDYASFDDYLARRLSKPTRKDLRRKIRTAERAQPPIELQVVDDVTPFIDEVYPLYLAVLERSTLQFEKLTREFLCAIGRRMPDKVRFFIWRQAGRAIAFSLCMVQGDTIYDEYLGLDYAVALDLHLYFYTLKGIIDWAIARGIKWYVSSALNYEPKLHLRCDLAPLDLYVAHTSRLVNVVMKRLLPWLEPTRRDPILRRFSNYSQLWGEHGH